MGEGEGFADQRLVLLCLLLLLLLGHMGLVLQDGLLFRYGGFDSSGLRAQLAGRHAVLVLGVVRRPGQVCGGESGGSDMRSKQAG